MHIVNNTSAMIMERFDTIMFVSVLYITKSHHWTVRIAACGASLSGSSSPWSLNRLSPVRPRWLMGGIDFRLPCGPMQIVLVGPVRQVLGALIGGLVGTRIALR
jgi:hypothetical protein